MVGLPLQTPPFDPSSVSSHCYGHARSNAASVPLGMESQLLENRRLYLKHMDGHSPQKPSEHASPPLPRSFPSLSECHSPWKSHFRPFRGAGECTWSREGSRIGSHPLPSASYGSPRLRMPMCCCYDKHMPRSPGLPESATDMACDVWPQTRLRCTQSLDPHPLSCVRTASEPTVSDLSHMEPEGMPSRNSLLRSDGVRDPCNLSLPQMPAFGGRYRLAVLLLHWYSIRSMGKSCSLR